MLKILGIKFKVLDIDIKETFNVDECPSKNVKRLALEKALAAEKKIYFFIHKQLRTINFIYYFSIGYFFTNYTIVL